MKAKLKLICIALMALLAKSGHAQDSTKTKILFNTGVGLVKTRKALSDVFHSTVAFNSGVELVGKRKWISQLTFDFNTLQYDQQVIDGSSRYLFQNTNSSLIMIGLNGGKNFNLNKQWFASAYVGGGYLSVGEPRVDLDKDIITQTIKRNISIFGRAGGRVAFETKTKLLQTVYLDGSWWTSPSQVQGVRLNGFSFFIGTAMNMK